MTRINLVDVEELSDAHLLAEYRELPRCIKQHINIEDAPKRYVLGKGHMKWAASYPVFLINRYHRLFDEMQYRGFVPKFQKYQINDLAYEHKMKLIIEGPIYIIDEIDLKKSRDRIIERYRANPSAHRWTKRNKPAYLEE